MQSRKKKSDKKETNLKLSSVKVLKKDEKEDKNTSTVALWQKLYSDYWKIKEKRD